MRWLLPACTLLASLLAGTAVSGREQSLRILTGFEVTDRDAHYIDESIAAGPAHLVVTNNGSVTIRSKAGALVATSSLSAFFQSVRHPAESPFDIRALFDEGSGRFFVVATAQSCSVSPCISHLFVAVSRDTEPASLGGDEWLFHSLDATLENGTATNRWADFPSLGVSGNAVIITMQMFPWDEPPTGFNKVLKLRIIKKSELLSGTVTGWSDFSGFTDPQDGSLLRAAWQPAHQFGDSASVFAVTMSNSTCGYVILGVANPTTTPTVTTRLVASSLPCSNAGNAPQPGGPPLQNNGGMRTPPIVRDGSLWFARAVSKVIDSVAASAIYWAQIDVSAWPATPSITQEGLHGEAGASLFYPTLAVDSLKRLALVYARSSTTDFPSLYVTGRSANDPLGSLRSSLQLKAGSASLGSGNATSNPMSYADYFGAAVDPVDGAFWVIGEYIRRASTSDRWVGQIAFDDNFTDGQLGAGTVVRRLHIVETRERIDAVRLRLGLAPITWTELALVAGASVIRAQHIIDLRSAIVATYVETGRVAPSFSDANPAGQAIKAVHIHEIRRAIVALE